MGTAPVGSLERRARVAPERRLEELARSRGALRRVLAGLCAAFVARQRWERLGYVRVGDYARERLGLSGRSLHDLARVGRALPGLPRLEAALVSGALPWSKVRLLARFVTEADESRWIALARSLNVRQLERRVRSVDRGALEAGALEVDEDGACVEPVERVRLRVGSRVAFQWQHTRRWAACVAGERVSPGTVLEMVTAEALSALPDGLSEPAGGEAGLRFPRAAPPLADVCTAHAPAPEVWDESVEPPAPLPAFLAPLLTGLEGADALELDRRLRRAVRLEQRLDAEIAPLLRQVTCPAGFARERLGMSPRKVRALLRLERVGEACPELRSAWRDGAISWVQAQVLAPLLLGAGAGSWRAAWLHFAQRVTVRRLEQAVGQALVVRDADPRLWEICRDDPDGAIEPEPCEQPARQTCARPTDLFHGISLRVTAPREVARLFRAVLCSLRKATEARTGRLPSEGEAFGAMLDHALTSWGVGPKERRRFPIFERDGWRCTVPGCTSQRNLHAHHVRFRSAGGSDAPENLTTLCAAHHHRHVHTGVVRIGGRAPDGLWFELPLACYRSGDRVA